jgi:DNA mismatch endonuclease (patch repair protein)
MPDVFTKQKRSEVMSKIRARGNKETELVLMAIFRRYKITGWRRHQLVKFGMRSAECGIQRGRKLKLSIGVRPDFVFPQERVAVFVDGCFWHGCPKHCRLPAGNRAFWRKKFERNRARDRLVNRRLRASGWRVIRIWEHQLRNPGQVLRKLITQHARKHTWKSGTSGKDA